MAQIAYYTQFGTFMSYRFIVDIFFAGLVASVAVDGCSLAASFDCGHAVSPREKLICSDPTLSDLDSELGRLYQERRALLSPHGAELLQTSERSWLHYVATVCPLVVPDSADRRRQPKNCLEREYQNRLKQLPDVGQTVGPFRFNRIDIFAAEPAPDGDGYTPGFYVWHVGYPQVDSPSSPQTDAWNKDTTKSLATEENCDEDTDYIIGYAVPRFISLQWKGSEYCHTAAHGTFGSEGANMVMQPGVRRATEQDIFGPTDDWAEKLQQLFWNSATKNGWLPGNGVAKGDIEDDVIKPGRWLFTANGLKIAFSAYEGGCYVCNPPPVTVPWSEIKPLLPKSSVLN